MLTSLVLGVAESVSTVSQVTDTKVGYVNSPGNYQPINIKAFLLYHLVQFEPGMDLDDTGSKHFRRNVSFGRIKMRKACDENIKKTLKLVEDMLNLADEGDVAREDTGCGVLYGIVRDSAYKIKKLAGAEKEAHIKKGWWKE